MTRTDPALLGALLDRRYRVDRLLARGGMSAVYRGVDTRLDRPVAIKIMDARFAADRSFVERFEREARSAARLHHPNVVAVHDQGVDTGAEEDRAFLVMELVDGGTLRDLLDARGALDVHLALSVAEPVLAALAAAHAAGLVHRDVKPENVLIGHGNDGSGVVKVGDFGLVRAVASAGTTSSSVILGTVAYLSPEQVATGATSERGDVYSTGILLYEMLTGQPPYTGDTALSVAYRHVNDDVPPPSAARPGLPPALDDLILRATRRDPQARPADAGAFLRELQRLRTELGIEPVPVPVPAAEAPTVTTAVADVERTVPVIPAVTPGPGPRGTRALSRVAPVPAPAEPPVQGPPTESRPRAPGRPRGRTVLWVALAVLLAAGIGAALWWFNGGRWVAVPDVDGEPRAAAEQALREAQLVPVVRTERHNTAPSGTVIRTEPPAGTDALLGDEVTVVVSAGRPTVPAIAPGTPVDQAEQAIRDVQLDPRHDPALDDYSHDVPQGTVLKVDPQPGAQANIGDRVRLGLSKGPPPTPVPNVVGQPKDAAFQALRQAGFEPYEAGTEFSADVAKGAVTRTDPAAGTTGVRKVGVYVSNAVEVPVVVGRTLKDAKQVLKEAGLEPDVKGRGRGNDDDDEDGFLPRFVIRQEPEPGTMVQAGSKVKLHIL
ncbi:serine/threonine protein kinase [Amycolatopsis arida]|uniref:non-specific serine/threonine protein kinase n=1 Tax=Amycolatopsis arida TaxID=587909 RepID=A0A1I5XSD9_9PSEU|nr:PASTA domain-containing protein [Amycolatopsis arida]TDX97289.1 serine/threonine-protein kinase [Amycolatopsis arida]SFQ34891.1 serine/threonine protein kinase [Amycolatopsis arida]